MPIKFFGQYLLDEGILEPHQLRDVADHAYFVHRTIGDLVVRRGLMSPEDAKAVHAQQHETDRFFGELCIEQGLLTPEQLEELLEHQRNHHARVGEMLVELGYLNEDQLHEALLGFHADQACYDSGLRRMPSDLKGTPAELVLELVPRFAVRAGGLQLRIGDTTPWSMKDPRERSVSITIPSTPALTVAISCEARFARALLGLSRGSVEPPVPEPDQKRALRSFLERIARRIHPGSPPAEDDALPDAGHAFDFISTRGDGLLILRSHG